MYKIVRSNYSTYRENYELELTEEYVNEFNDYFHSRTKQAYLGKIEITPKMMVDAFQWKAVDWDCDITMYPNWDQGKSYTTRLANFIRDLINEDVWGCDYESEFVDSCDTEDEVIEVE